MRTVLLLIFCHLVAGDALYGGVFDTVKTVPKPQQEAVAATIYQNEVRKMDSAHAMQTLNEFRRNSRKRGNKHLEVLSIGFKGYYLYHDVPNQQELGVSVFRKALSLAQKYDLDTVEAEFTNRLGRLLFMMDEYKDGFKYLLRSDHLFKEIGYENFDDTELGQYLEHIMWAYTFFNNPVKAAEYVEIILKHTDPVSKTTFDNQLKLGDLYVQLNRQQDAMNCFKKAFRLAKEVGDSSAIGISSALLGDLYVKQGKIDSARPFVNKAIMLCLSYPEAKWWNSKLEALMTMARFKLEINKLDQTENFLDRARQQLWRKTSYWAKYKNSNRSHEHWEDYYLLKAQLFQKRGLYKEASAYQDSARILKDSVEVQKNANFINGIETLVNAEKYKAEMAILEQERNYQRAMRIASWIVGGLVVLVLVGAIYGLRMRYLRKRNQYQMEKERAEEQIAHYRHQLHNFVEKIRQKNQLIEDLKKEPAYHVNGHGNGVHPPPNAQLLEKLHHSVILTDDDWVSFKQMFDRAYPGFIQSLKVKYPGLTMAERRFLALVKLDLTVQEMANMLGISVESVRKTRQRVRRKVGVESYKEIPAVVAGM